jgi:hypothetical protein
MRKWKAFLLLGLLLSVQVLWAQTQISGRVTDARDGSPLAGVTVTVKNTNNSTSTGNDGTFSIAASSNSTLVFSYVGFQTLERLASASSNVSLTQGDNALTEVVVVGYGQSSKRELTSSVTKVKGEEVANIPVPNFNQALQGRAAGVFVESNNGKVGEGVKVRIRGQGSINASNSPLYVVDGIPISTGGLSGMLFGRYQLS